MYGSESGGSMSISALSGASYGGSIHACFGLDHPDMLRELKLGPMLGKGAPAAREVQVC
jgi:hypothetical protein